MAEGRFMLSGSISSGIQGIEARIVEIEVDTVRGLPNFIIVGLPDSTIRESRERIRSAIENSGYQFPPKNFIVNLAPADFKKQGANFDLPIAMSILHATGQLRIIPRAVPLVGELSLDGRVKPVHGVIAMAISLRKNGYRKMVVPWENRHEAAAVEGLEVHPVRDMPETVRVLQEGGEPFSGGPPPPPEAPLFGFSDVRGQETAKRALEIAAAGRHNVLLCGAPGSGKTMLARRMPSILPPLTTEQAIETTMVHSVGGKLPPRSGLITTPPFRSPHHTSSDIALTGGGTVPRVGEVSLSHNGILFLDEFIEFRSDVLQALRQPLEDREITVSRSAGTFTFPADFMLIAASNPCRCGYYLDDEIRCTCSGRMVRDYFRKISGPILDRIDLEVLVHRVPYGELAGGSGGESSGAIGRRVAAAREMQAERFRGTGTSCNSRMTQEQMERHCEIDGKTMAILESAAARMKLTARSYFKILKVSRSIADLEGAGSIRLEHVLESLSYRILQKVYDIRD
jgi:magnesium chelatase family protein